MRVFGITGGIATGKSTVSRMITELGFTVIDADEIAHQVMEPCQEAYKKVVAHFGEGILLENQEIDRKKLGSIVFHDEGKRQLLNSLVHPSVRKEMARQQKEAEDRGERAVFLDIPLLYENGLERFVEKVIVVYTDEKTQLERLMKRNQLREEDALARIHSQMPIEEKKKRADEVIDNRGSREETRRQVIKILQKYDLIIIDKS